jgi:hypothetical protein
MLFLDKPVSINRKNSRLSFDSLRQIFTRIRKSFLLRASSASIQLAATEPDARTNCRTSSVLLSVRRNCLTNARTDCAELERSVLQITWFSGVLHFGTWDLILFFGIWVLGFGTCQQHLCSSENPPRRRLPPWGSSHSLSACSSMSFSIEARSSVEARRRWYFRTRISFNANRSSNNGRS